VRPGQILLLPSTAGGYDPELGWTGDDGGPVPEIAHDMEAPENTGADPDSALDHGMWVELQTHLRHVGTQTRRVAEDVGIDISWVDAVATAGQWHDVGKAHPEFQARLVEPVKGDPERQPPRDALWAKSSHHERSGDSQRRYFRHELASALAWLAHGRTERGHDLVGYLIAAHHGKVRLSIRSLPGEPTPDDPSRLFAHGVWDGDRLAAFTLPDGTLLENAVLDLSAMQLGRGSWLERMLALRDDPALGPFRLAMLETILRAADWRATRKEEEREYDDV
jgi:CRISPR-associated endonuclease/helicase Cas3